MLIAIGSLAHFAHSLAPFNSLRSDTTRAEHEGYPVANALLTLP